MNKANLLTIVILSRERQSFLFRQINYWKSYEFNVIILDQSINKLDIVIDSDKINYYHLDKNFSERIIEARNLIRTKYVIYLPDDEFLIPSCLNDCIDFLDENSDFFSCAGRSLEFEIKNETPLYSLIYPRHKDFEITSNNSLDRVLQLSSPYVFQPIHSVTRSEVWKTVSMIFSELNSWPPESFELFYGFTSAIYGKQKVLPQIMNLRSKENEPVNTHDWSQKDLIKNKLYDIIFLSELLKLQTFIAKNISADFGFNFFYGIHSYVNHITKIELYKSNIRFIYIKKSLIYLYNLFRLNATKINEITKILNFEKVKVDKEQLKYINSIITLFHKK